ncbi:Zn-dependent hydrolase [Caldibacillus lycopersici]|uniref:Zn-dependent hydrolase n=1 Tax=Perspicuibacillus lycopersici TaxID=1325689 RepID=A0AAE3IVC4_9BACI|nr:Zn-dependent hydrolase [Perspicuibacillus lycopersici]MCU9614897.1 Zn-dependent hydrolase [Perspicuibacillus lycopersici]
MTLLNKLLTDYDTTLDKFGISGKRLAERLYMLSEIGKTADGGSRRLGLSKEEKAAKDLVKSWMKEAGLNVTEDGAGNVFARLEGEDNALPAIWMGSHVDSVPNGGHLDGPLGVLAALEVMEAWKETGFRPKRSVEVVIFTDEEGSRFYSGLMGSRAVTGALDYHTQFERVDADGITFAQALEEYGSSKEKFIAAKRNMEEVAMFVEVHIEQGKQLEKANMPVGIVTGIAGPYVMEVHFTGVAGHAGNTPMNDRADALIAASEFICKVEPLPEKISETAVATVGKLFVKPNGVNVIPGKVELFVDIRDIAADSRDKLIKLVHEAANDVAEARGIQVTITEHLKVPPVPIRRELQEKLKNILEKHQVEPTYIPSGAGHDAMILGEKVPVAMIFARSKEGISHNPKEWTSLTDCVFAVHVLKDFIEENL